MTQSSAAHHVTSRTRRSNLAGAHPVGKLYLCGNKLARGMLYVCRYAFFGQRFDLALSHRRSRAQEDRERSGGWREEFGEADEWTG
jgi:hypothetical protein